MDVPTIRSFVDEMVAFRDRFWISGWAFDVIQPVQVAVEWKGGPLEYDLAHPLRSPDVAAHHGRRAEACRFQISGRLPRGAHVDEFELVLRRGPLEQRRADCYLDRISGDPYHRLERRFFDEAGRSMLEVGSRSRSGTDRLQRVGDRDYVGMDIVAGPNVDVVGDVHRLAAVFPDRRFDSVFAVSVFEHVLMPWKAAVEINAVLADGGLVFIGTHQTFPLHEVPWDYLRFSDTSWHGIFNAATGFEVLDTALGEPASIVPLVQHPVSREVPLSAAHLAVGVLARKTGPATVDWPVDIEDVIAGTYPQ